MKTEDNYIDEPIGKASGKAADEDRFGYAKLAGLIASSVKNHPSDSSITLGLEGSWGSGKTSMLNILREQIENESGEDDRIGTIVVSFSPWLITNREALIAGFFAQIKSAMETAKDKVNGGTSSADIREKLHTVRDKIGEFGWANTLTTAATIMSDPTFRSAIAAGGQALVEATKNSRSTPDLESQRKEIVEALAEIAKLDRSFKILVLIDDLDRLEPSEALEVVRLVKAVADFPTIVYLLAYDESLLAKAIKTATSMEDGSAYLEKIIQFSFRVPPFEPFQLRAWLKVELQDNFKSDTDFSSYRARIVLDSWASRLVSTPRDVKRILYATNTVWSSIKDNADLLDLVWLQMLGLKASDGEKDLYSWVLAYLQSLDASVLGGLTIDVKGKCKALEEILISLGFKNRGTSDLTENFTEGFTLPHSLDKLLAGITQDYLDTESNSWTHKFNDEQRSSFREEKRLSSPWHWRYYFALSPPGHALTDAEWEALFDAAKSSEGELKKKLETLIDISRDNRPNIADQLFGRLTHRVNEENLECPVVWTTVLMQLSETLARLSKSDYFDHGRRFLVISAKFVYSVIQSLSGDARKKAIEAVFKVNPVSSLSCRLARMPYSGNRGSCSLTETELEQVKDWQIEKYSELTVDEFQALNFPLELLFAWKHLASQHEPSKLVSKAFETDDSLICTLEKLRIVYGAAHNGMPQNVTEDIKQFTDFSALKSCLEKISNSFSPLAPKAGFLLNNFEVNEANDTDLDETED